MTGATSSATGLNITTGNSNVNGINVTHNSGSLSSSLFGIGGVLSSTNTVSGYNGYRNGSGLSYGIYGINGTNASYATNANTWAAFLQGRTVISSESAPTSGLGTDLEIRNTTTGAGIPATVSLRQTASNTTNGTVLANLNFGDNHQTSAQAQIQITRGAAGGIGDLPTDMLFYTTPDASATLTERMRIMNNGNIGIGTITPTNILSLGNTSAQKIWIENTASGIIGRDLTVAAGSTVAGGTNITGGTNIIQAGLGTGTGASTILFQNGTTLGTGSTLQTMSTKMTILGNGNVGINTSTPSAYLQVTLNSAGTVIPLRQGVFVDAGLASTNGYKMFEGTGGSTFCCGTIYGLKLDFTSGMNGTRYGLYIDGESGNYM